MKFAVTVILLSLLSFPAWAGEATLEITAGIIRCVTPEERLKACNSQNACCDLVKEEQTIASRGSDEPSPDPQAADPDISTTLINQL